MLPRMKMAASASIVMFDFPTLFVVTIFITAVAGMLLLFAWQQNRGVASLGMWGAAYLMSALAMSILAAQVASPGLWSILFAQPLWIAAHGLMWGATRSFEGRRTSPGWALAGVAVWFAACQFDAFLGTRATQLMLAAGMMATYLILCAAEILRGRDELVSRWPAIVLLLLHAAVLLVRVLLVDVLPFPGGVRPPSPTWIPVGVFELMFHTFCMSVLLVNMAKERAELHQRQNSLVDALTGVSNRRAFLDRGKALLRQTVEAGGTATLLLFDLDRFKRINDSFGHQAGDRVLGAFCELAQSMLRPGDLFSRYGGEEFACLVVNSSFTEALRTAERIRSAFGSEPLEIGGEKIVVTVSVGAAKSSPSEEGLELLFAAADRALYRAKARGRNRTETARPPLQVFDTAAAAG
jgi:diguanylate cyclase (GGDEF)-like protein